MKKPVFVGELSLDGRVRSVPGILPIVLEAKKNMVFNPVWCQKKMKVKESLSRELSDRSGKNLKSGMRCAQ